MNINTSVNLENKYNKINNRPAFGSAVDSLTQGLRFLNVNEAVGATLVDVGFMAMPRTIVDSKRGFDAGVETGIRENSGTLNHVLIGTIGGAAALALSKKFNKAYNVYAHSIFANNETIDILGKMWQKHFPEHKGDKKKLRTLFFKDVFENLQGLNSKDGKNANWVKLQPDTVSKITKVYNELASSQALRGKKLPKDKLDYLRSLIITDTGAEKEFKLIGGDGKEVAFSINSFLEDVAALGRAFSTRRVSKAFQEVQEATEKAVVDGVKNVPENRFLKELKDLKMRSALLALSISCTIGACVQPFNRWLTKVRTGSDEFVGVKGDKPSGENKTEQTNKKQTKGLKFAKITAATGMLGLALTSITTNFKELPNKIQFKGKIPTLNQYKLVYGVTVASRFLAARSGDELREACFKDILGFTNWLILGGFVSKAVVTALDSKNLLNSKSTDKQHGFLNWLTNKSVKTVDEVLLKDLKDNKIETVTKDGKAIPFKKLLQTAKDMNMTSTLKKIKYLNIAQIVGYIYSGLVLGILIPKLNIKMTELNNRKKLQKDEQVQEHTNKIDQSEKKQKPELMKDLKNTVFEQFMK